MEKGAVAGLFFPQKEWLKAIEASTSVLKEEPASIKGLYRRGLARSRLGLLEEARQDLVAAFKLDSSNVEVRKELVLISQLEREAKSKAKTVRCGNASCICMYLRGIAVCVLGMDQSKCPE